MGSIKLIAFNASIDFFHRPLFSFFFFIVFSSGKMRIFFLFFYLFCMILVANGFHGKTGFRERDSDASTAGRNQTGIARRDRRNPAVVVPIATTIVGLIAKYAKRKMSKGKKKVLQEWIKEMYEEMDPQMDKETKERILKDRLDPKKCAKSGWSGWGLCIDGKVVGCSLSGNLYYYCWHTCDDSWCWTTRFGIDLGCNSDWDCGRDAILHNEYEIPDSFNRTSSHNGPILPLDDVTDSVSDHEPLDSVLE